MAKPTTVIAPRVAKDVTVDIANVGAGAVVETTVTVKGLVKDGPVIVSAPSLEASLILANAHASAKDTLKFRTFNPTGGGVNPASQTIKVVQF